MPSVLDDPLVKAQGSLGQQLLGLYSPEQEQQRYGKALGQLQQTISGREAQSGLTGTSEEKDALTNAANNFNLNWAERQPAQLSAAISGSQLPIQNLLSGSALMGSYEGTPTAAYNIASQQNDLQKAYLDWRKQQANQQLYGGLFGSLMQGSGLSNLLFGGGSTGYGGGTAGGGGATGLVPSALQTLYNNVFGNPADNWTPQTAAAAANQSYANSSLYRGTATTPGTASANPLLELNYQYPNLATSSIPSAAGYYDTASSGIPDVSGYYDTTGAYNDLLAQLGFNGTSAPVAGAGVMSPATTGASSADWSGVAGNVGSALPILSAGSDLYNLEQNPTPVGGVKTAADLFKAYNAVSPLFSEAPAAAGGTIGAAAPIGLEAAQGLGTVGGTAAATGAGAAGAAVPAAATALEAAAPFMGPAGLALGGLIAALQYKSHNFNEENLANWANMAYPSLAQSGGNIVRLASSTDPNAPFAFQNGLQSIWEGGPQALTPDTVSQAYGDVMGDTIKPEASLAAQFQKAGVPDAWNKIDPALLAKDGLTHTEGGYPYDILQQLVARRGTYPATAAQAVQWLMPYVNPNYTAPNYNTQNEGNRG